MPGADSERALTLAPRGRDAEVAASLLAEAGIRADACSSLDDVVRELKAGAGFVLVTEESIATADLVDLSLWIARQEEWSDLPFVLLTQRGGGLERNPSADRFLQTLGNVTFLERPFHPTTLVSVARSAIRSRRRQYEARARLAALRNSERQLLTLNETLEKRVAETLAERKLLADIVEGTDAFVQVLDADHRILAVNHAAAAAFGRLFGTYPRPGDVLEDLLEDVPESRAKLSRVWSRAVSGHAFTEVVALADAWGEERLIEMKFNPLRDHAGRIVGAYHFASDVTDRVRDQHRLAEATAKMHEMAKLETLGQLTGGVAHDFNNLLMPITGALDLLNRRYGTADPRSARTIGNALQSAERAKTLVQRLLGFARRQTLEAGPGDIGALLTGMRDLIASSIGSRIELRLQVTPGLPPALVDANQFELAILNLCVNARDAMPNGGTLTVAAEAGAGAGEGQDDAQAPAYVRVRVSDTGAGMDEETLTRAVEPFFTTKSVGTGTGLGLSMVHGLAAQLGGSFMLSSTLGHGTTAVLSLPVAASPAPVPGLPGRVTASAAPAEGLRILLVDDEELVRAGTAEMLRDLGHAVIEANGGAKALGILAGEEPVDLLITDYTMPRMSGVELARVVRDRRPHLPVLIVTGYAGGSLDLGFPQLAKPFRQDELSAAVQAVAGHAPLETLGRGEGAPASTMVKDR